MFSGTTLSRSVAPNPADPSKTTDVSDRAFTLLIPLEFGAAGVDSRDGGPPKPSTTELSYGPTFAPSIRIVGVALFPLDPLSFVEYQFEHDPVTGKEVVTFINLKFEIGKQGLGFDPPFKTDVFHLDVIPETMDIVKGGPVAPGTAGDPFKDNVLEFRGPNNLHVFLEATAFSAALTVPEGRSTALFLILAQISIGCLRRRNKGSTSSVFASRP
jgi:hypothetical protein